MCLTNLKSFGVDDIVLLFSQYDDSIPDHFRKRYGAQCFVYPDNRLDKWYIPSIKPYLWWQYLKANPEAEHGEYFYMDADVIFREIPDFEKLDHGSDLWLGSDTESYIGPDYIKSKGTGYLSTMAQLIGITDSQVASLKGRSAGAQWILTNPKADYWQKVYTDCNRLYRYFEQAERMERAKHDRSYVPLQKWTAEMWAQLWNMPLFGVQPAIDPELDFISATDDIEKWDKFKIYHNNGVTADNKDLFFKGQYVNRSPFADDLSFVNKHKCSYRYAQAIERAKGAIA